MAVWVCTVSIRRQTRPDYVDSPLEQSPHVTGTRRYFSLPFGESHRAPRSAGWTRVLSPHSRQWCCPAPPQSSVACSVVAFASRLSVSARVGVACGASWCCTSLLV